VHTQNHLSFYREYGSDNDCETLGFHQTARRYKPDHFLSIEMRVTKSAIRIVSFFLSGKLARVLASTVIMILVTPEPTTHSFVSSLLQRIFPCLNYWYAASNRNEYQKHTKMFLGNKPRPVHRADNLTAICEPMV
jgi:hypothetical protein